MRAGQNARKSSFSLEKRRKNGVKRREAPVGFEPTMADLQSAALATWLRRLKYPKVRGSLLFGQEDARTLAKMNGFSGSMYFAERLDCSFYGVFRTQPLQFAQ